VRKREGKGKGSERGGLDVDFSPGAPKFLVTPLPTTGQLDDTKSLLSGGCSLQLNSD